MSSESRAGYGADGEGSREGESTGGRCGSSSEWVSRHPTRHGCCRCREASRPRTTDTTGTALRPTPRRVLSIHVDQAATQRSAWSWLKQASGVSVEHRPRWLGDPRPWRSHGLQEAATMSAGNRPTSAGRVERVPVDALGKATHDRRSPAQFAADLEAETDRSLRSDPGRWRWVSSLKVPGTGTGRR